MNQWIDRVKNHAVWDQMKSLGQAIDTAAQRDGIDAETLSGVERIRTLLSSIGQRLASVDPALVLPSTLDGINNAFSAATQELQQFTASGSTGHIANANANADSALASAVAQFFPISKLELATLNKSATQYRDSVETAFRKIQQSAAAVDSEIARNAARLDEIAADGNNVRQRSDAFLAEVQAQFSRAQEVRASDFSDAQQNRQDKFTSVVADFSDKLSTHVAELAAIRAELQRTSNELLASLQQDYESQAGQVLARIQAHERAVEKLVGVIGTLGVTSGYQKAGTSARNAKWLWQGLTVSALVGVIAFAWRAFLPVMGNDFSWPSFAGRSILTLTVGLLAAYAAKQSDKASMLETYNRGMALELEAFGPFIAPLSPEKQEAFRLQLGERTFGSHLGVSQSQGESSPANFSALLKDKQLTEFVTNLVRAARS